MADPPKKMYKGEVKTLAELAGERYVVAQSLDPSEYGAAPNFLVIKRIQPSWRGRELKTVTVLEPRNGFREANYEFRESARLNILTGTQGTKLRNELKDHLKSNGIRNLGRFVGNMGADPEVFVVDKEDNVVPSWTFLGSKTAPTAGGEGYYYARSNCYWDGFQAEFDVGAGTCLAYVVDGIRSGILGVHRAAKAKDKGYRLTHRSVLPVPPDMLRDGKEEHVQFGCAPSKNAYGLVGNQIPGREVPIRFAGGHIHFGAGTLSEDGATPIVKALDAILGVTCVSLFQAWDNPVRREFYGLPGEYRLPRHGLEYRTLSNAWLVHPVLFHFVFDLSRRAYALGEIGQLDVWEATEDEVVRCIGKSDVGLAQEILTRNKGVWIQLVEGSNVEYAGTGETAYKMVWNGAHEYIKEPDNFEKNWLLNGGWVAHGEAKAKQWRKAAVIIEHDGKL